MENLINSILTLDNDEKYFVLNQAIYQNKNYYFLARVTEDEEEVLDEFKFAEEVEVNGERAIQLVQDEKIIELLAKYFEPKE